MLGMEIIDSFEFVDFGCIFPGKDIPSLLLNQVLQLAPKCVTILDFFYFILWFTLDNNRSWGMCDLVGLGVIANWF
jgi:hypothetical protein